jgi:hypothetical protein
MDSANGGVFAQDSRNFTGVVDKTAPQADNSDEVALILPKNGPKTVGVQCGGARDVRTLKILRPSMDFYALAS